MSDKVTKPSADAESQDQLPLEDTQQVVFVKPYQPYNEGEVGTFLKAKAEALVNLGVAEKVTKKQAEARHEKLMDSIKSQQAAIHVRPSEEDLNARNSNPKSAAAPWAAPQDRVPGEATLTTADGDNDGSALTGAVKGTGSSNNSVQAPSGAVPAKAAPPAPAADAPKEGTK